MKLGGLIVQPRWFHETTKLDRCNQRDLENRSIKVCSGLGANRVSWRVKIKVNQLIPMELISSTDKTFSRLNISNVKWIREIFKKWVFFKF